MIEEYSYKEYLIELSYNEYERNFYGDHIVIRVLVQNGIKSEGWYCGKISFRTKEDCVEFLKKESEKIVDSL